MTVLHVCFRVLIWNEINLKLYKCRRDFIFGMEGGKNPPVLTNTCSCGPGLTLIFSVLSSFRSITLPLSFFRCCLVLCLSHTFLKSPPLVFLIPSLVPLRLSLLGTLYLLSPSLAASSYYLFAAETGETERITLWRIFLHTTLTPLSVAEF